MCNRNFINLSTFCLLLTIIDLNNAQLLEGLYCGKLNCYDVLGVTRESSKSEIARNYRQLAKKYHPDLHKGEEAKKVAEEKFKLIATAYETLKDDEARTDYDYMLDHPDEYYANYYRYYRRKAPKVDIRIVLFVTISVISVIQYYSAWQRYETAIKYFVTVPKYRNHALDIAKEKRLIDSNKKMFKGKSKTEQKEYMDIIIRKIIEENMDIKGAYAKPSVFDILWVQLIICPYTVAKYIGWYIRWVWKFYIMRQPYGKEEKLFMVRKYMKMGENQFNSLEDEKIESYLKMELWKKDKYNEWYKFEEEKMKKQLAENGRYKQYRRYLKTHGVGRMTFDDS